MLSEGAGLLVLERSAHAEARGAAGYADVTGGPPPPTPTIATTPRPEGSGAAEAMRGALADAAIAPSDIDYLNAHGTGTKLGDIAEARAIRTVFPHSPPVSSIKGHTGHMLGASGAVEAAATAAAISRGILPPTHNLDDPDPECDLDHIRKEPRAATVNFALSNSFAFGGHNTALVFAHPSTTQRRSI